MSDLKSFVALQAKLYEFLLRQDEATLQALASGAAQLAVLGAGETPPSPPAGLRAEPSSDPLQAAQDLQRPSSVQERRAYLHATGFTVMDLKKVAKALGLRNYSGLRKANVIDLLAGHDPGRAAAPTAEPNHPAHPAPPPPDDEPDTRQHVGRDEVQPARVTTRPEIDAAAIASRLREIDTEEEGGVYLQEQQLDREGLLAVAAELQLTRVERLSQKELRRRVLKQAIGARRKFAGLRNW
ncbi:Rho termination factor N-terminal domain-containing protein [Amycolatopsis nalaikhensis]|uniref:Rho termination factor N-terminal domain-containing protein n=1 Tax=Amycolatopsis nalaikhensis TaxID=715472 RepID=A0ABY8XZ48_9PSEU|nr:Rho termination factor N-terminal domain-containing protein [Amycolatopsis sp. 2-2]WIV60921.1 Rho termination factor N-terminal domain-containing protein [Amycolatopsis sp. 2-2]